MKNYGIAALTSLILLGGCSPLNNGPIAVATPVTEISVVQSKSTVVSTEKDGVARTDGTYQNSKSNPTVSSASAREHSKETQADGQSSEHNTVVSSASSAESGSLGFSQNAKNIVVTGSNITRTFDANGQDLAISGSGNHLKITGRVHGLAVTGKDNAVRIDNSLIIDVKGTGNSVVYAGATPIITKTGNDNQVTRSKP